MTTAISHPFCFSPFRSFSSLIFIREEEIVIVVIHWSDSLLLSPFVSPAILFANAFLTDQSFLPSFSSFSRGTLFVFCISLVTKGICFFLLTNRKL